MGFGGQFKSEPVAAGAAAALRDAVLRLRGTELDVASAYLLGRTYASLSDDLPTTITLDADASGRGERRRVAVARDDLQRQYRRYGTAFLASASEDPPPRALTAEHVEALHRWEQLGDGPTGARKHARDLSSVMERLAADVHRKLDEATLDEAFALQAANDLRGLRRPSVAESNQVLHQTRAQALRTEACRWPRRSA